MENNEKTIDRVSTGLENPGKFLELENKFQDW
jgi:hypothetical protein